MTGLEFEIEHLRIRILYESLLLNLAEILLGSYRCNATFLKLFGIKMKSNALCNVEKYINANDISVLCPSSHLFLFIILIV